MCINDKYLHLILDVKPFIVAIGSDVHLPDLENLITREAYIPSQNKLEDIFQAKDSSHLNKEEFIQKISTSVCSYSGKGKNTFFVACCCEIIFCLNKTRLLCLYNQVFIKK